MKSLKCKWENLTDRKNGRKEEFKVELRNLPGKRSGITYKYSKQKVRKKMKSLQWNWETWQTNGQAILKNTVDRKYGRNEEFIV